MGSVENTKCFVDEFQHAPSVFVEKQQSFPLPIIEVSNDKSCFFISVIYNTVSTIHVFHESRELMIATLLSRVKLYSTGEDGNVLIKINVFESH